MKKNKKKIIGCTSVNSYRKREKIEGQEASRVSAFESSLSASMPRHARHKLEWHLDLCTSVLRTLQLSTTRSPTIHHYTLYPSSCTSVSFKERETHLHLCFQFSCHRRA